LVWAAAGKNNGSLSISYREIPDGAGLAYRTQDPALVAALHQWFTVQVSGHGPDAVVGHDNGHHRHHEMPAGESLRSSH
jgi:hypothetical protein